MLCLSCATNSVLQTSWVQNLGLLADGERCASREYLGGWSVWIEFRTLKLLDDKMNIQPRRGVQNKHLSHRCLPQYLWLTLCPTGRQSGTRINGSRCPAVYRLDRMGGLRSVADGERSTSRALYGSGATLGF